MRDWRLRTWAFDGEVAREIKNFRESIEKRIDAKVEQLRPALNDRQLEQYRTELEGFGNLWIRNLENVEVVGE